MTENARLLLAILRDINASSDITLTESLVAILRRRLGVTSEEIAEITTVIADDTRKMNADYPGYGHVNDVLKAGCIASLAAFVRRV